MSNVDSLREALRFSPDNIALRLHLADVLYFENQFDQAALEYQAVLQLASGNVKAKCGLAKSSYSGGKKDLAFVVLEDICKNEQVEAEYHLLFARILLDEGRMNDAQSQYKLALDKNPMASDNVLDNAFRIKDSSGNTQNNEDPENEMEFLSRKFSLERPTINFDDVGGMAKIKEEIKLKIIHPLTHPEIYRAYGKKIGGGILLYGPPGCGKTYLAKATAGQVKARFICIGIQDILDMWIGSSEKNLHQVFELARANTPCVLFFDEVDALAASRSDMKQSAGRHLINQFLQELDGVNSNNEGVLILAATNAPWHLDAAFRRPGRFDRIIFVAPPDVPARAEILKVLMQQKPQENIQFEEIAHKCSDFSGADLKALVDITIEHKLTEAMSSGIPSPILTRDILNAIKEVKPSTKDWFVHARNYALYANESGHYNDILQYLNIK
jgi:transitional endoplasmic reticulum ATPase